MKIKGYNVYRAGGEKLGFIWASCISKAAQKWINSLERPAAGTYKLESRQQASIRYGTSNSIISDFIVMEAPR